MSGKIGRVSLHTFQIILKTKQNIADKKKYAKTWKKLIIEKMSKTFLCSGASPT